MTSPLAQATQQAATPTAKLYVALMRRANGVDVNPLLHLFETEAEARDYVGHFVTRFLGTVTAEVAAVSVPLTGDPVNPSAQQPARAKRSAEPELFTEARA